ncbi:Nitrogen regulation protein NtrY [hydrothermal vent metagenome]|uniref:histidine kinase n=1 Tax=hydrothermal vent metagenome TaxID=652676 RepID=A0A3B0SBP0_9ZZZZ
MSIAATSGPVAERFSRPLNLLTSAVFGALYALTITVTILSAYFALSGAGKLGPASQLLYFILLANLALILGLAGYLAIRLFRLMRPVSSEEFAPRLHVRFAMLFSGAAVLPAIVVGIFFAVVYSQGIESWFSPVVQTAVDKAATVAEAAFVAERDEVVSEIRPMAIDLNKPQAVSYFKDGPIVFSNYLQLQAQRRFFSAAYIIDGSGTILSAAELDGAPVFAAPTTEALEAAVAGSINLHFENEKNLIRGLYRLRAYDDAYLYVARYATSGALLNLYEAQQARNAYSEANSQRGRLTRSFALVYAESALLVLIGAIWVGLAAANQVVFPIGRLARAAHRVRDGDLSVRIPAGSENDELASLGRDFNEMTSRLETQRTDLIAARDDSERRRNFTETVLSGVSAGVFGVDGAFQITLANRSACELLRLDMDNVIGKNILEVAPFFDGLLQEIPGSKQNQIAGFIEFSEHEQNLMLNVHITPESGADRSGYVITFDDMSKLVSDQRSAAWREVARRIAHEIRNPLTPIQLSAERLRRKYRDEITTSPNIFDRCIDTIVRQVGDIGRMVDEFSSFARMPEPKIESVELWKLAEDTMYGQQVAFPDVKFVGRQPDEAVWVDCDARLSAQAILNILKNAAESASSLYKQENEPGAVVEIQLQQDAQFAWIDVVDNGPGWPKNNRQRLVEPYFTTRQKGTGLGLAIVKRILEDHKGQLELLDRKDGQSGAVVRLSFPLSKQKNEVKES